jgi:eukaryotic-like serine/threonine-protein kinase
MDMTVADPLVGELLDDRYRIRGRIARGGMATVYQAVDTRLERLVAIKIIHPAHAGNAHFLSRFDREAKTIAQLTHPNVVAVFDSGQHRGLPYLVMEYVPGRTLRDVLADRRQLTPAEALAVAEPMLAALAAAHRAGLVHRDVKPENILIGEPDGRTAGRLVNPVVKVADFGLARAVEHSAEDTTGGQLMATVAYVPPELVRAGYADARSDVYSAGIVLFELLTGNVPFHGNRPVDVAYQHVEHDVPAPSRFVPGLPAAVDELVVRATRREPGGRPTDAGALLAELRNARQDSDLDSPLPATPRAVAHHTVALPAGQMPRLDPGQGQPVVAGYRRRRPGRGLLIGLAVILALGLVAGVGGWWFGAGRYTQAPSLLSVSKAEAMTRAHQKGFTIRWRAAQFSETARRGTVLSQAPEPGGRILSGGTITAVLSKGPERYTIPELAGRAAAAVTEQLRAMHLEVSSTEKYDDDVAEGTIISVSPKPGTVVRPGAAVHLAVSKGPAPVTVPDVRDEDADDAAQDLADEGLQVQASEQASEDVEAGRVISQSPAPGTGVDRNSTVKIVVSSGPPLVEVPDVSGERYKRARQQLLDAGFDVQPLGLVHDDGTVRRTDPGGGSKAPKGSRVLVWVI